ncbi:hypothetical protein JG688_00002867 [Phytophthora aleatoria]|uniref:Uncharacterized protein n=1 Tax=Phytophthora aleatoria TaxID=2496075 RepID=A0A8J5MIJ8_9STRA|nr:hypothetical protein JG688_00002867 [Phytophthora aleatoria]
MEVSQRCWVEVETNFEALHGASGATAVGGKLRKKGAFEIMLKHLKSMTLNKALAALTGRNKQYLLSWLRSRMGMSMNWPKISA